MYRYTMGVYVIRNTVTGRVYVGQSSQVSTRWTQHKVNLKRGSHTNKRLQRDWDEYGESAFEFSVAEYVDDDNMLRAVEGRHMREYEESGVSLYNLHLSA